MDDNWFKSHIPFWESPDAEVDATYYYRWELATKHLSYGSPESGYNFTEFINRVPWSGRYGSISCPMGLQLYEARWLRDGVIAQDYARYWFSTPGAQPRTYSNWYGDALWANYLVSGDKAFMTSLLPSMEAQYEGWMKERWRPAHAMFAAPGVFDGMEGNIGSRQTTYDFGGAQSYRPTLNSYVFGDLNAIANTAQLAGDAAKAASYRQKAAQLKARVQDELWDPRRQFFLSQFADDEEKDGAHIKGLSRMYDDGKFAGDSHGRELIGFVPWMFNLPDKNKGYEAAWKGVSDPDVFLAPLGLYFAERHDPLFFMGQSGCWWSGNNWPYANSQVLTGMANVLNNYPQKVITKADYWKVMRAYTLGSRKDGKPYFAEDSDADTGRWVQDAPNSSDHYFHSSYNDLVITGLAGLRPRADDTVEINPLAPDGWAYFALDQVAYHGHNLSIVWDKDGTRYGRGAGLSLFADSKRIASAPRMGKLSAKLPALPAGSRPSAAQPSAERLRNFAVNNDGTYYPRVHASFNTPGTSVGNLVDGIYYYHSLRPVNRWTSEGSTNASETMDVDFGVARPLENVKLYLLDDGAGSPVRAPAAFDVQFWDGAAWQNVPGQRRTPAQPRGHQPNIVAFPTLRASKLRVVLKPQPGASLGLTELEAWGRAPLPLPVAPVMNNLARTAQATASFTSIYNKVEQINDGRIEMDGGGNRWTAFDSPNASDWVQLDWKEPVTVSRMEMCLWADGGGVRVPRSFTLQSWNGTAWVEAREQRREPAQPTLSTPNEISIEPVRTTRLRVTFAHAVPGQSGVTEWLVWGPGAPATP